MKLFTPDSDIDADISIFSTVKFLFPAIIQYIGWDRTSANPHPDSIPIHY